MAIILRLPDDILEAARRESEYFGTPLRNILNTLSAMKSPVPTDFC